MNGIVMRRSIPFSRTSMTNKEIIENYNAVMVTMLKMIPAEDVASMSLKVENERRRKV